MWAKLMHSTEAECSQKHTSDKEKIKKENDGGESGSGREKQINAVEKVSRSLQWVH